MSAAPARPHQYPADPTPKVPTVLHHTVWPSSSGVKSLASQVDFSSGRGSVPRSCASSMSRATFVRRRLLSADAAEPRTWQDCLPQSASSTGTLLCAFETS